ncbi:MAG: hypothetical protein WCL60_01335 [Methylococcales bacterium]
MTTTYLGSEAGNARIAVSELSAIPTGILSLPLTGVGALLAQSANFQTWLGINTDPQAPALAQNAIHYIAPDASGTYPDAVTSAMKWPFAILNLGRSTRNLRGSGLSPLFSPKGEIGIYFEAKTAPTDKNRTANPAISFLNAIGGIITDLESASQGDGGIQILSLDIEEPERKEHSCLGKPGDFYTITIRCDVGFR